MKNTSRAAAVLAGVASVALLVSLAAPWGTGSALAAGLGVPSVVGPTDSAPVLKDVTLTWTPVTSAVSYDVEVGTDGGWSDTPSFTGSSSSTALTVPVALAHASYVWHVRAVDTQGHSNWSSNGTFTHGWLDSPVQLVPSDGQHVSGVPSFLWSSIEGASAYELQVSTCPLFNDQTPTTDSRCVTQASTTTPTATATSASGAPTPVGSTDNHPTQDQAQPTVYTCYTNHLTVTPFDSEAQQGEDNPGACIFKGMTTNTNLYWRVRAGDRFVGSAPATDTTPASSAGISHLPPGGPDNPSLTTDCPGLSSPSASASASATASASSTASASATATPDAAVSGCAPTHPLEFGAWSPTQGFTFDLPAVVAGDYTTLPPVQTDALPSSQCPADVHGPVCSDFPTLSWSSGCVASSSSPTGSVCPTSYRLYISLDAGYSNITRIVETQAQVWTPTDDWRESTVNQSYYYAVQPCTSSGCGAVTSSPPSFRKATPPLTQVSPIGGATITSGSVQLQWQSLADRLAERVGLGTAGASAYHLQIVDADANPSFDSSALLVDATVDGALCALSGDPIQDASFQPAVESCDGTGAVLPSAPTKPFQGPDVMSYTPTVPIPDGHLAWRVQAVDGSGHRLAWSPAASFTRDTNPPTASMTPLRGVSPTQAFRVTFSAPVTGVNSSSLTLSPAVPTSVTVTSPTTATLTPAIPLAMSGSYQLRLSPSIRDAGGLSAVPTGPVATLGSTFDDPSTGIVYAGSWGARFSSSALGSGYHRSVPTTRATTAATAAFFGTGVVIGGCVGPSNGFIDIYVDGLRRIHLDTFTSSSSCGLVLGRVTGLARGYHRVQFRGLGTRRAASAGTAVGFDAFRALP